MIRILAKHFVAGAILYQNYWVIDSAPIIKYIQGWSLDQVRNYCEKKGWTLETYE